MVSCHRSPSFDLCHGWARGSLLTGVTVCVSHSYLLASRRSQRQSSSSGIQHGVSRFPAVRDILVIAVLLLPPWRAGNGRPWNSHGETRGRKCSVSCHALWEEFSNLEGPLGLPGKGGRSSLECGLSLMAPAWAYHVGRCCCTRGWTCRGQGLPGETGKQEGEIEKEGA